MATKSKKTKKPASAYTASQSAGASAASAQARATNSAYDFMNFAKNFSPSQFFNMSSLQNSMQNSMQNYQPANLQQLAEQMMETSQKNLETMTACTQVWVEHAKETMENQASFATKLIQEAASSLSDAFSTASSDPREKFEEITELTKTYIEKTTKQARKAAEENMEIAQKIGKVISQRVTETVEELRSAA